MWQTNDVGGEGDDSDYIYDDDYDNEGEEILEEQDVK